MLLSAIIYITLKVVINMTFFMLALRRFTEMGLFSIFKSPELGQKNSDFDMAYLHGLVLGQMNSDFDMVYIF